MADDEDHPGEIVFGRSILPAFESSSTPEDSAAEHEAAVLTGTSPMGMESSTHPAHSPSPVHAEPLRFGRSNAFEFTFSLEEPRAHRQQRVEQAPSVLSPLLDFGAPILSSADRSESSDEDDSQWNMAKPVPAFVTDTTTSRNTLTGTERDTSRTATSDALPMGSNSPFESDAESSDGTGVWEVELPAFEDESSEGKAADITISTSTEDTAVGALQLELNPGLANEGRAVARDARPSQNLPGFSREGSSHGREGSSVPDDNSEDAFGTHGRTAGDAGTDLSALARLPAFGDTPVNTASDAVTEPSDQGGPTQLSVTD